MKKNTTKIFIAAVFLTISGTAFAQEGRVGINTSTPAATLDVVASPSNATRIDGFIAPRLKGSELKAKDALYTTAQEGAIVYVTEAVSGVTDKTTNVTSIGYYYFDKTQGTAGRWMKIANPSAAGIYQEPWNNVADGTPATINTQNIYQMGKVGIGTNLPLSRLHLGGDNTPTLTIRGDGDGNTDSYPQGSISFLESGATNWGMNINFQSPSLSNSDIYNSIRFQNNDGGTLSDLVTINSIGNVGIGTIHPSNKLHVVSTSNPVKFEGLQTGTSTDQIVTVDSNGVLKKVTSSTLPNSTYQEPWVVQGSTTLATTNSQAISQNASVAIGKSTAYNSTNQTMLDVAGAVRGGTGQAGVVGSNSAAFGNGAIASGTESFAIGNNTTASGAQSFAGGGNGATASGVYSYSFGNAATSLGNHAVAMGVGTVAPARSSVSLGRFNINSFTSADITANADGDPIFQLGVGADTNNRWNTITSFYLSNSPGWVAIGGSAVNTMPTRTSNNERLRVYGGTLSNSSYVTDINSVTGAATDKIVVADATTGQLKTISATGSAVAYQEPWVIQGSTTPATTNSQAISQNASVAIGKSSAYSSTNTVLLDVAGAIRGGSSQAGVVGNNSVAFGQSNTASNWQSTAIGDSNTSSGVSSIAIGSKNKATGDGSFATGNTTTASATNSFATGNGTTASGSASFAAGQNTTASGSQATAVGNAGKASGNGSFAGGYWNSTNGASVAAGQSSFAFGEGANAYSDYSFAFGKNAKVNTENGIVLGSYNELTSATNALFQLANGTSSATSNAITVLTDGKTGIGTAAPTQKLDVNGATRLRGQIYDNTNTAGSSGQVLSTNTSGQVVWQNNVAITPTVIGVMNNSAPNVAVNAANYGTGTYIELPPGKWVVNVTMLLTKVGTFLPTGASLWIRAGFSPSNSTYAPIGNTLSGLLMGPSQYGLMNGISVINNASGSTQKYYLWRVTSQANGTATGAEQLDNFAGVWGENQIVATPVN